MDLNDLGWKNSFREDLAALEQDDLLPARVLFRKAHIYSVFSTLGELTAELSGNLANAADRQNLPVVGDWVALRIRDAEDLATIHAVLPRKSAWLRKEAGARTQAQVIAANIDTVLCKADVID